MAVTYSTYITNVSNYDEGDGTYTQFPSGDEQSFSISLNNPFKLNGISYSVIYINSNGVINFTGPNNEYGFNGITSQWAGFFIIGVDLNTELPYFIRYKEFEDKFVVIYNTLYYEVEPTFQVKITLYLENNISSGDVVADFGNVVNNGNNSQFGISFGTQNESDIIQNVNFLNYTYNAPYVFNYPYSPNQDVTSIQSTYSNKQLVVSVVRDIPCFNQGTKILTNKGYVPIQDLRKGDLVKTLLHKYKPIVMIGKRETYHPDCKERIKSQLYKCSQIEYPEIIEPLIITGCHSILVDSFTSEEQKQQTLEVNGNIYVTDNKYRLPICADSRASVHETPGTYTIYHLALENDDYYMNYGIFANGLLVESCSKRYLTELSSMRLIE